MLCNLMTYLEVSQHAPCHLYQHLFDVLYAIARQLFTILELCVTWLLLLPLLQATTHLLGQSNRHRFIHTIPSSVGLLSFDTILQIY